MVLLKPGWIEWDSEGGTTHGQPHDADARVPLLVWGAGVAAGEDAASVDMDRVASTVSAVLGLETTGLAGPLPLRSPAPAAK